jgi:Cys-rich repeat protein
MLLPAFLARKWLLLAALLAIAGCQFPHYDFPANGGKPDAGLGGSGGGGSVGGSSGGGRASDSGGGGSSGEDAMSDIRQCTSTADCADASETVLCDTAKGKCVQCMSNADCPAGFTCGSDERCAGCLSDLDCRADTDSSARPSDDGGDGDASTGGLTCGKVSQKCEGCTADLDCPPGSVCDRETTLCMPGCTAAQRCPSDALCCDKKCISSDRTCEIMPCPQGWGDCNGVKADGCETKLNSVDHCLDCSTSCMRPNQASVCGVDGCMWGDCADGFYDCNGPMWMDGCEVDGRNDINNCGGCNKHCVNPHGSTSCSAKVCKPVCSAGFEMCGGDPALGCIDPKSDPANCGMCGHVCKGGGTGGCTGGTCICPDTKPPNDMSCNDAAVICGPYGWVGSMDRLCLCFCVNSKITCRINTPDGDGC